MVSSWAENFMRRFRGDREYRTVVKTVLSSVATVAVGTYNLAIAFFALLAGGNPTWLFTLSAYHYSLAIARIAVLLSHRRGLRKGEDAERRQRRDAFNYLFGGTWLVLLTLTYSGIIVLVTVEGYHYEYHGNFIYFMALYAFWKVISSVVGVVRYKKFGDYTMQTLRNFNLADGIVSIIALQSALLYAFSEEGMTFVRTMNAAIGGVAGLLLLALGTLMIVKGCRRLALKP